MKFKYLTRSILTIALIVMISVASSPPQNTSASTSFDLTPNQLTFAGRRGTSYNVTWDLSTYEFTFSTPDNTFPWDWVSFVGYNGAVALSGLPSVGETFSMSDPAALSGANPGDIWRIKGNGVLSQAHVTKLGLVIGSGGSAQRAWFSDGTISEYVVAPEYIGYTVNVLGRTATVRISSLNPNAYYSTAVIEVTLDNPSNARLILASDLEPASDYSTTVEVHNRNDTLLSFNSSTQAIQGTQGGSYPVYMYSNQPLHSWSASNLTFSSYLNADTLNGQVAGGSSTWRVPPATRQVLSSPG